MTVQLIYDSLSRVTTEVQGANPLGTTGKTVIYTWDAESNRTKIDYPSGFDADEACDALGRLSACECAVVTSGMNVVLGAVTEVPISVTLPIPVLNGLPPIPVTTPTGLVRGTLVVTVQARVGGTCQ